MSVSTNLEFPSGIELLQTLHSLLSVHHGRHRGPLLKDSETRTVGVKQQRRTEDVLQVGTLTQTHGCFRAS